MFQVIQRHVLVSLLATAALLAVGSSFAAGHHAAALAFVALSMLAAGLHSPSLRANVRRALYFASFAASGGCFVLLVFNWA